MQERGLLIEATSIPSKSGDEKHPAIGQVVSISEEIHMPDKRPNRPSGFPYVLDPGNTRRL
jgi:hypothetical protein